MEYQAADRRGARGAPRAIGPTLASATRRTRRTSAWARNNNCPVLDSRWTRANPKWSRRIPKGLDESNGLERRTDGAPGGRYVQGGRRSRKRRGALAGTMRGHEPITAQFPTTDGHGRIPKELGESQMDSSESRWTRIESRELSNGTPFCPLFFSIFCSYPYYYFHP